MSKYNPHPFDRWEMDLGLSYGRIDGWGIAPFVADFHISIIFLLGKFVLSLMFCCVLVARPLSPLMSIILCPIGKRQRLWPSFLYMRDIEFRQGRKGIHIWSLNPLEKLSGKSLFQYLLDPFWGEGRREFHSSEGKNPKGGEVLHLAGYSSKN